MVVSARNPYGDGTPKTKAQASSSSPTVPPQTTPQMQPSTGQAMPTGSQNSYVNTDPDVVEQDVGSSDISVYQDPAFTTISSTFSGVPSGAQANSLMTNLSGGIFGMPYQFPEVVDPTVSGTEFGAKYIQKIVSVMPVMFITPGAPVFMAGYSDSEKRSMLNLYGSSGDSGMSVEDILEDPGSMPFYVFDSKFSEYCSYVNIAVRALSNFLGLSGEKYYDGGGAFSYSSLGSFRLENVLNSSFKSMFGADTSVAFYLDTDASISETFSNSSTESELSQKVNQYSDKARELNFLMDSASLGGFYDKIEGATGSIATAMNSVADQLGLGAGVAGKLASALTTVVSGGKMIFPNIWNSSGYSRNYTISIKLRSPDFDPLSIMLNIYVPLICLICLAMPMQVGVGANAYKSPFLVRATYKSMFMVDNGLVTSLSISKGGENKWNADGMPTAVDVSMDIEDLYQTMFMSKSSTGLINNMAEMDYLSLMAGLDMNKAWITRQVKLGHMLNASNMYDQPGNMWQKFKIGANKSVNSFLHRTLKTDTRFTT